MEQLRVGIIGGGYMGKAHAVAARAVQVNAELGVEVVLYGVAASNEASAMRYRQAFGFQRAYASAEALIADANIDAVIVASPQDTHLNYVQQAARAKKPVLCEKPMGRTLSEAKAIAEAAQSVTNLVGYNYIQTPATVYARQLIQAGELGDIMWCRVEHNEDFLVQPDSAAWRLTGEANGVLGDLMPHPIQNALALAGPIHSLCADMTSWPQVRGMPLSTDANDDQVQFMCRFANGANGLVSASRVAHGRKMGYAYEIHGTRGALRFDQEDQNALWVYRAERDLGFQKVLSGPDQGGYDMFCQGPGHGTGYQDQIILEQAEFFSAHIGGRSAWPGFQQGVEVMQVVDAVRRSVKAASWVTVLE